MSKLTVDNQIFNYPDPGKEPNWGQDATGWAEAVTDTLQTIAPTGTIFETQITLLNTPNTAAINGLIFNQVYTEAAAVSYHIFRKTDDISYTEKGTLDIVYDPSQVSPWVLTRTIDSGSPALVNMDIDDIGQVNYTCTVIGGANYTGYIIFKSLITTSVTLG